MIDLLGLRIENIIYTKFLNAVFDCIHNATCKVQLKNKNSFAYIYLSKFYYLNIVPKNEHLTNWVLDRYTGCFFYFRPSLTRRNSQKSYRISKSKGTFDIYIKCAIW